MWNCSHYQSLSRKESPKLYCCSLSGDSTCHQSHRSLCDLLSLWEFCQMALYRALGSLLVATALGIFLGFIQTDSIQKEHRKAVHEHDFRDLSKGQKIFQVLVQAIDEFFEYGTLPGIWLPLCQPRPSLCPNTDPHFDQCDTCYCYSPSHGLVLSPLTL